MGDIRNSGQAANGNRTETLSFCSYDLGQCCPHHYPHRRDFEDITGDPLGAPMTISQVAKLLGCSIWTLRQKHLRSGLPHFRIGKGGKLLFYRKQVIEWILETQEQSRTPLSNEGRERRF